jgi:hypothetical protein
MPHADELDAHSGFRFALAIEVAVSPPVYLGELADDLQ